MSTYEYIDLCKKAQNKYSKYQVYTFDIVNSKKMNKQERIDASIKLIELMKSIYLKIKEKEIIENKYILLKEDVVSYEERLKVDKKFGLLFEPFFFADTFGFTVYTGSIEESEVLEIYEICKTNLDIKFLLHINNLYYETNDYCLGNKLFFRGYAIDICSTLNKQKYSEIKENIEKNAKNHIKILSK